MDAAVLPIGLAVVALVALIALGSLGLFGGRAITGFLGEQANIRLHDAARRSALLIESLLLERRADPATADAFFSQAAQGS